MQGGWKREGEGRLCIQCVSLREPRTPTPDAFFLGLMFLLPFATLWRDLSALCRRGVKHPLRTAAQNSLSLSWWELPAFP